MKAKCIMCVKELNEEHEEDMIFTCDGKCTDDYAKGGCLPPGLNEIYFNKKYGKEDNYYTNEHGILIDKRDE